MAWKHLQHPNVLPLLGATITDNKLCLISEWADQGNIIQYLNRMEHLEVNRFELVSCNRLFWGSLLICAADWCRRRTVVYARPPHGPWKPKRSMPLPLVAPSDPNLPPSRKTYTLGTIGHVSQVFPCPPWRERDPGLAAAEPQPPPFRHLPLAGPFRG